MVPAEVVLALRDAVSSLLWMIFGPLGVITPRAGLFRACFRAGGPTEAGSSAFLGTGLLRIRNRRLGGGAVGRSGAGRLYGVSHSDEVDVGSAQYFVNSSLAPVVLFRMRLKSVADLLQGIRNKGFILSGCSAGLLGGCNVVKVRVVPSLP